MKIFFIIPILITTIFATTIKVVTGTNTYGKAITIKTPYDDNGVINGIVKSHLSNGKLFSEVKVKDNNIEEALEFYETGDIYIETPYKNNKKHGIEIEYTPSGNILTETPYVEGKIDGVIKEYDLFTGKLRKETEVHPPKKKK